MRSSAARALSVVGLGAAGLVGGHAIGYALAVPDVHHRSMLLADTGHGYLPSVSWIAVVLGLAAVVGGVMSGYVRRPTLARTFRPTLLRLLPAQVGAFIALEVFERLAADASLGSLSWRLVAIGVAAQIVMSVVAAMLLAGLRRLGRALAASDPATTVGLLPGRFPDLVRALRGREELSRRVRAPPAVVVG